MITYFNNLYIKYDNIKNDIVIVFIDFIYKLLSYNESFFRFNFLILKVEMLCSA